MFGGKGESGELRDLYVLQLDTFVWSELSTRGHGRRSRFPGETTLHIMNFVPPTFCKRFVMCKLFSIYLFLEARAYAACTVFKDFLFVFGGHCGVPLDTIWFATQ